MLCDLPIELLEIILAHCSKATIKTICLVSRDLYRLAIQHLYRLVLPTDTRRTIQLFWSLVYAPLVAGSIRTLHVRAPFTLAGDVFKVPAEMEIGHSVNEPDWNAKFDYWVKKAVQSASIHRSQQSPGALLLAQSSPEEQLFFDSAMMHSLPVAFIEHAFRNMTSLQTLVVHTPSHPHMWTFTCELPALRHITIHKHADSSLLVCWLAKQPGLTSIQYSPSPQYLQGWFPNEGPEVEPHFLPNLREITTDMVGVIVFVPGRPVETLNLDVPRGATLQDDGSGVNSNEGGPINARVFDKKNFARALRASTTPIKRLTLSGVRISDVNPFLQLVTKTLPSLTYLNIKMDWENQGIDAMLEEHLGSLPHLTVLEAPNDHQRAGAIVSTEGQSQGDFPDREKQLATVTRWARLAHRLSTVVLHPESPTMESLARSSEAYGIRKYTVSIIRWAIHRNGPNIEVSLLE
ncbi:hypothetical protein M408DRAFT_10311 [Serendipita vermifera MAFF 305830]|uniref:F-box domain-containing protein n=1 Tax=Serendipita vermifera MAFF 305830 TaxID=933852 RepID=A0A0C3B2E8_SERVB|nr:hypothetical protein M408DRAFT_10311 [Serendipita vermifera MAFF 305830]